MRTLRTPVLAGLADVVSPVSTCRNHRRKKTIPNNTNANPPRIATRNASCGVMAGRRSSRLGGMERARRATAG
jgi:hypothetical protein